MFTRLLIHRSRLFVLTGAALFTLLALSRLIREPTRGTHVVPRDSADLLTVDDTKLVEKQPVLAASPLGSSPKASILVIWEGVFPYSALAHFFTSFRANAPTLELVWIGVHKDDGDTCLDITPYIPPGESNIRHVCLTRREYWAAHRDYFCNLWQCSEHEREEVLKTFMERNDLDHNKSLYRLWRGYIFRRYVNPNVAWWGWADVDIYMGSFQSLFPWDIANDYDVIIPAIADKILYLRGHLAFMQMQRETEDKMNLYDNMRTIDGFIHKHKDAYWCTEESEFSAFVIRHPQINFIILPHHLADTMDHLTNTAAISSLRGTYRLTLPQNQRADSTLPALTLPQRPSSFVPTFSDAGKVAPITIHAGNYSEKKWFPDEFVTWYTPDFSNGGHIALRFIGRGGGFEGGPQGVWERVEPPRPATRVRPVRNDRMQAELSEGLYVHWFHLKHAHNDAFKSIPTRPLAESEAIVEFADGHVELWDTDKGNIVWRSNQVLRGHGVKGSHSGPGLSHVRAARDDS